ncbi:uncharacterized protein LOC131623122 [Vicia villosa]|uniref:uncharacterized protein LOC131623122 n=1 Tax=Vicia villosa TaxID=3911 RepID=UPI00273C650C|nr:uncharacterized protein LOC131623122 [Vicia villosa]
MAGRGGRNDDVIAEALGMIAGMLGENANGAGIGANRKLAEFQWNNPPLFNDTHDPDGAQKWLKEIERIFWVIDCAENLKGSMTVPEYASKFFELAKYYVHYNNDKAGEFSKCIKFENGVRDEIKQGIRIFEEDNLRLKSSHSRELIEKKGKKPMDRGKPYDKGNPKAGDGKRPSGGDSGDFVRCYNCGEVGHRRNECKAE